ncbi:MAG: squalene/phytoene synthase family protein [Minwuia sp.]|nr:squalene/phytoene synthase family protein [Minwuia sp.]
MTQDGHSTAGGDPGTNPHGLDPLAADLRTGDADRFYTAMFAAPAPRKRLLTLYAFNLEVARTRERVSEPMLGQIRLQWWREALDEMAGGQVRNHPVCTALNDWLGDSFPAEVKTRLEAILTARELDLEDSAFPTLDSYRDYAATTGGILLELGLHAVGMADRGIEPVARHVGTAYAITGLIRAIPFAGTAGRMLIPQEVLERVGATDSAARREPDRMRAAVEILADQAQAELLAARQAARGVRIPGAARPVLLHRTLAAMYLHRIRRAGHDLSSPRLDPDSFARISRLLLQNFLRRF